MAAEETLISHSSEVRQNLYLVQIFLGGIAVAKGIFVPNMKFVRLGTRELLSSFSLLLW